MSEVIEVSKVWANMKISEIVNNLIIMNDNIPFVDEESAFDNVIAYNTELGKLEGICLLLDIDMHNIMEKAGLTEE